MKTTIFLLLAVYCLADKPDDLAPSLKSHLAKSEIPALAAGAIVEGKIVALGVAGVRKKGEAQKVTMEDRFHLGSCTKSMTSTLAAILVHEKKLKWDSTLAEIFPKMKIHEDFREVTLTQLLNHTGGMSQKIPMKLWKQLRLEEGTPTGQRALLTRKTLTVKPAHQPGRKYEYSNTGYAIAGHMMEVVTGVPYEKLMVAKLFKPLGMKTVGFGTPATPGKIDHPYGHHQSGDKVTPVDPGPAGDNPTAIAPAGTLHCSLGDFLKYARFHLDLMGQKILPPDQRKALYQVSPVHDYALGWVKLKRKWAGGTVYYHNGTNTMNFAVIWLAPEKNSAFIALTNCGQDQAARLCDDVIGGMIEKYMK